MSYAECPPCPTGACEACVKNRWIKCPVAHVVIDRLGAFKPGMTDEKWREIVVRHFGYDVYERDKHD